MPRDSLNRTIERNYLRPFFRRVRQVFNGTSPTNHPVPLLESLEILTRHAETIDPAGPILAWGRQALKMTAGEERSWFVRAWWGFKACELVNERLQQGRVEEVTIDINRDWNEVARRHWREAGVADRIEARLSPGLVELEHLLTEGGAEQYDFAFLDADKRNYPVYFEQLLTLLRPGGLLVADNVLWNGDVIAPQTGDHGALAIQRFNAQLSRDRRVFVSMIPLADGLTLAVKNANS